MRFSFTTAFVFALATAVSATPQSGDAAAGLEARDTGILGARHPGILGPREVRNILLGRAKKSKKKCLLFCKKKKGKTGTCSDEGDTCSDSDDCCDSKVCSTSNVCRDP